MASNFTDFDLRFDYPKRSSTCRRCNQEIKISTMRIFKTKKNSTNHKRVFFHFDCLLLSYKNDREANIHLVKILNELANSGLVNKADEQIIIQRAECKSKKNLFILIFFLIYFLI